MNHKENYLPVVDTMRGLMALWVVWGHFVLYCTGELTPWGAVIIAVDVFMFLSGFLMAYHWCLRRPKFANLFAQSRDFYIRRFFRIAPLYYFALTIAFLGQDYFFRMAHHVLAVEPASLEVQSLSYHVPLDGTLNIPNILTHYTFLFGFFPQYSANTILPDWSIGLEMQFYLIFPFLMIFWNRITAIAIVICSMIIVVKTNQLFGLHLYEGVWGNFPQASLILFKINIFVAGMCLAYAYLNKQTKEAVFWSILSFTALWQTPFQVKIGALALLFVLFFKIPAYNRFTQFLGDVSYSVYLIHKLVFFPALYFLCHQGWFIEMPSFGRLVIGSILIPIVYGVAYLIYQWIEIPGIALGRRIVHKTGDARVVV